MARSAGAEAKKSKGGRAGKAAPSGGSGRVAKAVGRKKKAGESASTGQARAVPGGPRDEGRADSELVRRAGRILRGLRRAYPEARCALDYRSPLDLYVATVLSAQCTDERVNQVTPELFRRCRRPQDYLSLGREGLEEAIRPTGFFRAKARSILQGCLVMIERFGGRVPGTMEELVQIPGVGRKTANVLLGEVFDTPGITVDTHVRRLSRRMELTEEEDPVKIEFALQPLFPRKHWTTLSHLLIHHGRACCRARKPECGLCPVAADCPYPRAEGAERSAAPGPRSSKAGTQGRRRAKVEP